MDIVWNKFPIYCYKCNKIHYPSHLINIKGRILCLFKLWEENEQLGFEWDLPPKVKSIIVKLNLVG